MYCKPMFLVEFLVIIQMSAAVSSSIWVSDDVEHSQLLVRLCRCLALMQSIQASLSLAQSSILETVAAIT